MKHLLIASLILLSGVSQAQDESSVVEQRLRESLKSIAVRLRTAETDRTNLQAAQAQNDVTIKQQAAELEELKKKLAALSKQAAADQDAARKSIDGLNAKIEVTQAENTALKTEIVKWKEGFNKAAAIARAKEAERAAAVSKAATAENKLADRERQNLALFNTGLEILERYKNFGLGKALLAREPFTSNAKVKLQEQVQDYTDKLEDNRHNPFRESPPATAAAVAEPVKKP